MKKVANIMVFKQKARSVRGDGIRAEGKKIAAENILIAKILVYSAIKIKAKGPLLYSVLNPETSSDSPSARSKGVRFVSANIVISHMENMGNIISAGHEYDSSKIELKLKNFKIRRADRRIRAMETS